MQLTIDEEIEREMKALEARVKEQERQEADQNLAAQNSQLQSEGEEWKPVQIGPQPDSKVDGLDNNTLENLQSESSSVFSKHAEKVTDKELAQSQEERLKELIEQTEEIETANKHPTNTNYLSTDRVGAIGIQSDIDLAKNNHSYGVRDFYNHAYDDESRKAVKGAEYRGNIELTGSIEAAREHMNEYDSNNKFNTAELESFNDTCHANMTRTHKAERSQSPKDTELHKRHEVEEALFKYRESKDVHSDLNEKNSKDHKELFTELMNSHLQYIEITTGEKLDPVTAPKPDAEYNRFVAGVGTGTTKQTQSQANGFTSDMVKQLNIKPTALPGPVHEDHQQQQQPNLKQKISSLRMKL